MSAPIRLLALDVDGTLLDSRHRLSPAVREALEGAAADGVEVVLTSARGPDGLRPVLRALRITRYAVSFAGALVCRTWPDGAAVAVEAVRMDLAAARAVVLQARALAVSVGWWGRDGWLVDAVDPVVAREATILKLAPGIADLAELEAPPFKLQCMTDEDGIDRLRTLRAGLPEGAAASFSNPNYLEVLAPGVDKALGLARLGAQLGIAREEMAAVGDGENDLPMLRTAGVAIAVANARPAVREVAHHVVPSNDEAGVAAAVALLRREGRIACCSQRA